MYINRDFIKLKSLKSRDNFIKIKSRIIEPYAMKAAHTVLSNAADLCFRK